MVKKILVMIFALLVASQLVQAEQPLSKGAPGGQMGNIDSVNIAASKLVIGDIEYLIDPNVRIHLLSTQFASMNGLKAGMQVRFSTSYSAATKNNLVQEIWELSPNEN